MISNKQRLQNLIARAKNEISQKSSLAIDVISSYGQDIDNVGHTKWAISLVAYEVASQTVKYSRFGNPRMSMTDFLSLLYKEEVF